MKPQKCVQIVCYMNVKYQIVFSVEVITKEMLVKLTTRPGLSEREREKMGC